jgi:hypothetical protein
MIQTLSQEFILGRLGQNRPRNGRLPIKRPLNEAMLPDSEKPTYGDLAGNSRFPERVT